ncbi:MAG: hypothetical protein NTZ26_11210 [Candidatus Aminicenantes bacterium]|nr:hypothetical protein [Candidatus Aminicenantes bacterium]
MRLIYIDQNILGYLSEGKIDLPARDNVEWVYSDEHLSEIERSGMMKLLESIDILHARKIIIERDAKNHLTNKCSLDPYRKAEDVYNEYLDTTGKIPVVSLDLPKLQAFLHGNKDAIQRAQVAKDFEATIMSLLGDSLSLINNKEMEKTFKDAVASIGNALQSALNAAADSIKPIEKTRKLLAGIELSTIDETEGPVIDRIWELLGPKWGYSMMGQLFPSPQTGESTDVRFNNVVACYTALNYLGYWPDSKISNPSKIPGINSDASHVGHASYCSALLSEDFRMCKKAKAIYQYLKTEADVYCVKISSR